MTTKVISNLPVWCNGYNFSSSMHEIAISYGADEKECTTLADSTHLFKNGLLSSGFAMNGYWDETTTNPVDSQNFAQTGANSLLTFSGEACAVGDVAYFMNALQHQYNLTGDLGEMFSFTVDAGAAGSLVRGIVELNSALTSSGSSAGYQHGGFTGSMFAALHVTAVDGTSPTFDAVLESDDNAGFTSPTTRATFTQVTGITSEMVEYAATETDDYYRITYTIGGTGSPSFTVAVSIGIVPD